MSDFEALWPGGPVFRQAEHVRLGTDTVLLADFVKPEGRLRGIDLGCASGALMLLLLARAPRLHMTGIELDPEAAERARENLAANGLDTRGEIVCGDLRGHRTLFAAGSFDLVAANPPYYPAGSGLVSADPRRAAARGELTCTLGDLCAAAGRAPVATHMNAYALHPHSRNLTDERYLRLTELGGVAGISLYVRHLSGRETVTAEDAAAHLCHYESLVPAHAGFGCDYDGSDVPEDLCEISHLPAAADCLRARGMSPEQIDGIYYKNVLRFLGDNI